MRTKFLKNLKSLNKIPVFFLFLIFLILVLPLASNNWKLKIKGTNKEINTHPIIKGTSVFVDIYDLSNLFNIDYEVNLTRKYILFHRIPVLQKSEISTISKEVSPITTISTTYNSLYHAYKDVKIDKINIDNTKTNINKLIYSKLSSINTIVISNPINEVKVLDDNNYKTYIDDIENIDNTIKTVFFTKSFKKMVLAKDFKLDKLDLNKAAKYLLDNNIDGMVIPIIKKYYYYEKDGNTLIPTVEIQINYLLLNNNKEILFFNVQNINRTIAILSSSSVRYRKSKLLDLTRTSVEYFLRDYEEYINTLSQL